MKIVMYGDSITDFNRTRDRDGFPESYGFGYVFFVAGELLKEDPLKYEIINRGVSGNRVVDLYGRLKGDVWNLKPDVVSILVGVNDVWHELDIANGVDIERFERLYGMMIEETLQRLPNVKIIVCEPFIEKGSATESQYEQLLEVKEYAKAAKRVAEKYGVYFLPLQEKLDEAAARFSVKDYVFDGVHPNAAGSRLIAEEWLKLFKEKICK
ncbi:MAG: SGNH/GDSL hydrolase family protein [Clostridia bacterium]|nr:SGNH/GDSL hydrolase family protein [Clostridia bacterium]